MCSVPKIPKPKIQPEIEAPEIELGDEKKKSAAQRRQRGRRALRNESGLNIPGRGSGGGSGLSIPS